MDSIERPRALNSSDLYVAIFPLVSNTCPSQIRRGLVEIYDATTKSFVQALAAEARTAPIPFAHVSIDRWTANNDDFVGTLALPVSRSEQISIGALGAAVDGHLQELLDLVDIHSGVGCNTTELSLKGHLRSFGV